MGLRLIGFRAQKRCFLSDILLFSALYHKPKCENIFGLLDQVGGGVFL